jgi:molecular chaperone DnaK
VSGSADGTTFLVYDLGGGTFDISLIRMTDTSVEVLAVGGNSRLGGADWDEKFFNHILERLIAQWGDDGVRDDEAELQGIRTLTEQTKKDLSKAESKQIVRRYSGTAAKVAVTRKEFEEMTADLLDETIRITRRTLDEAEARYPGIRGQISQLLLVGGSTWMPAVAERLKQEFSWEPRLSDPDLAVAKGAALYAAGQTVRFVEPGAGAESGAAADASDHGAGLPASGPVTDEAVRAVAERIGVDEEKVRDLAQRTVVNVLPKAIGVALVDTTRPNWKADLEADPESVSYIQHLIGPQTQLPVEAETFVARTIFDNQTGVSIEIWEQAGEVPGRELASNHRVDDAGLIEGLGGFSLPAGSPIRIDMKIDGEGLVHLHAVEPTSGHDLEMNVRISVLSREQVEDAKQIHRGLTISTS